VGKHRIVKTLTKIGETNKYRGY